MLLRDRADRTNEPTFVANASLSGRAGSGGSALDSVRSFSKLINGYGIPSERIDSRVAEHVDGDGLGEGVELGDGLTASGSERIGRIQHRRNPSLLRNRWWWDLVRTQDGQTDVGLGDTATLTG